MSNKGFTLIEVIVALAIFALASVVISQSFMGGLISLEKFNLLDSRDETFKLIDRRVMGIRDRGEMERGGSMKTLEKGFARWDVETSETAVEGLYKVVVHVELPDQKLEGRPYAFGDSFYLFRPEWAQ